MIDVWCLHYEIFQESCLIKLFCITEAILYIPYNVEVAHIISMQSI